MVRDLASKVDDAVSVFAKHASAQPTDQPCKQAASIGVILWRLYRDNGREHGNYYSIPGYILGLYWAYMEIVEKNMETTIIGYLGLRPGAAVSTLLQFSRSLQSRSRRVGRLGGAA